nr:aminotransferase class V-fold PLP-dependent enzyme [Desulfuromonas acetoxidans]
MFRTFHSWGGQKTHIPGGRVTSAHNDESIIYLDNSATSFPKPESVYQTLDHISRTCGANPGRGSYSLANQAAQLVLKARLAVASLFAIADCSRVVFTGNATSAINQALFGLLESGDRVVTTSMEHNAVARPLHALKERGVIVDKVQGDTAGQITCEQVQQVCSAGAKPKLVVINHCSNVTGTVQPIDAIGPWCREQGILFMVDAAQSAGVYPIDVQGMAIDLLAAPGHKSLFGPQGTGFLYVGPDITLKPLVYGGTGTLSSHLEQPEQMPERFESGTLNTPALAALTAGIDFLMAQGLGQVHRHEFLLAQRLRQGLGEISGITLYGPENATVVSFTLSGCDPAEMGFILDRDFAIAVRVGLHCAPEAHKTIGSFPLGTVRVSPGFFNTEQHIERLIEAVREIADAS